MGSLARKQRREIQRKFATASISSEKADACIEAMKGVQNARQKEARAMEPMITERVMKHLKEKVIPDTQGQMVLMFLIFMHDRRGYGAKRLHNLVDEFNLYADDLSREKITRAQMREALAECGFDVDKEFSEAERKSNEEAKRWNRRTRK